MTPGANGAFTDLTEEECGAVRAADVLVAQLEIPVETVTEAAVAARDAGTRVVLNAAPARPLPDDLLAAVDVLVVNEREAHALTGRGREDPRALLDLAPRAVLTLGAEGAWYGDRDGTAVHVPPVKVDVVDSTAAGDAFTAALAVGWGEGVTSWTRCAGRRRPVPPARAGSVPPWPCRSGPRSTSSTRRPDRRPSRPPAVPRPSGRPAGMPRARSAWPGRSGAGT